MSDGALHFSRTGNLKAVAAGIVITAACGFMVIDGMFWFVPRYEAGKLRHRFFTDLNYGTGGWLEVIFGLAVFAFFALPLVSAFSRLFTQSAAVEFGKRSLIVHPSFTFSARRIPYCEIHSATLTTEGEAISSKYRIIGRAIAPMGARSAVSRAEKKICAVVEYNDGSVGRKKLKISAQFIDRGEWALGDFVAALKSRLNSEI